MRNWINICEAANKWYSMSEKKLREYARQFEGMVSNEMSSPDNLRFTFISDYTLASITDDVAPEDMDWDDFYQYDVKDSGQYTSLENADFHTPIVLSEEDGRVILWDGYHRVAIALARGDDTIAAIVGYRS